MASMLEMYVSGVSTRSIKIVEELCGKPSLSPSFQLNRTAEPMVNEWQNRLLSEKIILTNDRCTLYKSTRRKSSTSKAVI